MDLDNAGRYWPLKVLHDKPGDTLLQAYDRQRGELVAVKRLRLDNRGPVPGAILRKYLEDELVTQRYFLPTLIP